MDATHAPAVDSRKLAILKRYDFFRTAADSLKQEIIADARGIVMNPDAYFFQPGSHVGHLALVGSGSIRVFVQGDGGREVTLYHLHAGDSCPINLLSILLGTQVPAFAVVESPLHAVLIRAACFEQWVFKHAAVRRYVFETFASRMMDVLCLIQDIKFRRLESRLAEHLMTRVASSDGGRSVINITHSHLALELGSAREVISRLLREFERVGMVNLARGKIYVKDAAALQKVIEK